MLNEAQNKCIIEWEMPFSRYIEITQMSRSRAYECLAVHRGAKTIEQVRETRRERDNKSHARTRECPPIGGQTYTIPHSSTPNPLPTTHSSPLLDFVRDNADAIRMLPAATQKKIIGTIKIAVTMPISAFRGTITRPHYAVAL